MKEAYSYLLIVAASMIWGTMGILGKLAFEYGIHPVTLIALRLLISSLTILVPIIALRRKSFQIRKRDVSLFLVFGIFAVAFQRITYFYAVDLTTATIAAILFYTYPIFVTIYAASVLKEKVTFSTIAAIILTFVGVALVVKIYETTWLNATFFGIVSGMLSSAFFALYFLTAKKLRSHYTNWTLMFYGDGIGAAFLTPIIFSTFPEIASFPGQLWLLILAIAWFPSLLAYSIYSYAIKHVESSKGSILSVIEPLSAVILSTAILGEDFEQLQIIGVALALTGVIVLFYKPKLKN
ncbi:EamA family transporter [Candidatus Bathyarchaeota archaeon]|nr:EamA family transporter [Candidatus Bathyarchaeota archaeon]